MKNKEIDWLLKEKYQGVESEAFHVDCARLAAGVPLGYIIGFVPFIDCVIHLDSKPLIPRPETEWWTEKVITIIRDNVRVPHQATVMGPPQRTYHERGLASELLLDVAPKYNILDLCAGSGAIGVAVAKAIPTTNVTFAELDASHLPTIEKNIEQNLSVNRKVLLPHVVVQSDLYDSIDPSCVFDFILTNPPYIDADANTVDQSVVDYEPHLALFGGNGGIEIIERIIAGARAKLAPHTGELWIEHEPFQVEAITRLAAKHHFNIVTHQDQYDIPRVSVLTMAQ